MRRAAPQIPGVSMMSGGLVASSGPRLTGSLKGAQTVAVRSRLNGSGPEPGAEARVRRTRPQCLSRWGDSTQRPTLSKIDRANGVGLTRWQIQWTVSMQKSRGEGLQVGWLKAYVIAKLEDTPFDVGGIVLMARSTNVTATRVRISSECVCYTNSHPAAATPPRACRD